MTFALAERFLAIQGEGFHAGVPMVFLRFAGCSVGKGICVHCDTDFTFTETLTLQEILDYTEGPPQHPVCLTGGEPLDHDLSPLVAALLKRGQPVHVETSGTRKVPLWATETGVWITFSPKPGWDNPTWVEVADEIKVIHEGLGRDDLGRWVNVATAELWADRGKRVFLQPRASKDGVNDQDAMRRAADTVLRARGPLRLSLQTHKWMGLK